MTGNIENLGLERLGPGLELAHDVIDARGRVLLAAGTKLTEARIATLRSHGIAAVPILIGPSDAEVEARRERLLHLFRESPKSESDQLLREALFEYRGVRP